jgi:hypothetical protein
MKPASDLFMFFSKNPKFYFLNGSVDVTLCPTVDIFSFLGILPTRQIHGRVFSIHVGPYAVAEFTAASFANPQAGAYG